MSSTVTPPVEAKGYCRNCGKALTQETAQEVHGVFYCGDCLAALIQHGPGAAHPGKAALAGLIGIVPGLGAIYNGDFLKGAIHVGIFGLIISMISTGHAPGLFIPMLVAWILYMPFEAYQTAKAKLEGTKPAGVIDFSGGRHQTGPVVLIVMGVVFLLNQYELIDLDRIANLWPLGMIGLGVWMLIKRKGPTNG
jgi:hypothetical protein